MYACLAMLEEYSVLSPFSLTCGTFLHLNKPEISLCVVGLKGYYMNLLLENLCHVTKLWESHSNVIITVIIVNIIVILDSSAPH